MARENLIKKFQVNSPGTVSDMQEFGRAQAEGGRLNAQAGVEYRGRTFLGYQIYLEEINEARDIEDEEFPQDPYSQDRF